MSISLCIVTYNRLPHLKRLMESILSGFEDYPYELIVADGGSDDGTIEYLKNIGDLKLIEQKKLTGTVKAFNECFKIAKHDYILPLSDDVTIIPVEPTACPTMTRAPFVYDFGDTACTTPLLAMHSLGHSFVPPPIHAGGLRYHGMAPLVCQAIVEGLLEPRAYHQLKSYEAAVTWSRTEGFIPAPETSQALAAVVEEAQNQIRNGKYLTDKQADKEIDEWLNK